MKTKFSEALEDVLNARDKMISTHKDSNSSHQDRLDCVKIYYSSLENLDQAHKISLLDLIAGDSDATQ